MYLGVTQSRLSCFEAGQFANDNVGMPRQYYLTCLWPGLPELWFRGQLTSLPIAIAFAAALNAVLVTRYVYPGILPTAISSMAFWIGGALWFICGLHAMRELPLLVCPREVSEEPDRFAEAHSAYLTGDYVLAEDAIGEVLAIEARDPPALLILVGIYRHTDRLDAAEILLQEIRRTEAADRWFLEVSLEEKRLSRQFEQNESDHAETPQNNGLTDNETGQNDQQLGNSAQAA